MNTLGYIIKKFNLDIRQPSPIEIPNYGRFQMPELFNELGFKTGAEIGVEKGNYLEALCKGMPGAKLFGIDSWKIYKGYRDYGSRKTIRDLGLIAKKRLKPYNCKLIKKYSMDALNDFADESLDFVYIDANHEFRYVAEDIVEWSKKVRSGGIIYGHDYMRSAIKPNYARNHVIYVVGAYTQAFNINPWFIIGTKAIVPGEVRDQPRSWMWVKG